MTRFRPTLRAALSAGMLGLAGCGGGGGGADVAPVEALPQASGGQVAPPAAASKVSHYAASRFAAQASFGPTPALVATLRSKGFSAWIDEQFALPASQATLTPYTGYADPAPPDEWSRYRSVFADLAVGAPDQLRLRVTWALSQFIVVSDRKVDLVATLYWLNLLQSHGLGRYDTLLNKVSVNPAMGHFLDNSQNRPKSNECMHCAPNENFARELMQLFSLGVFKLNADGTPVKDTTGKLVETYTQKDVEELARVLTGWTFDPVPENRPSRNWGNWGKPMVPTTWPPERDSGAKKVLGKTFPAGQTQAKDLADAIAMLMAHPNIAPFVATRLIQHLVKSNPTPAYVGRVAAKFRNNGAGVVGDMKAVVKAVLLDAEARVGDDPATARTDDGKFREPFLHLASVWRGLACKKAPANEWGAYLPSNQSPFNAESVFSFYAPTDRAPGSNLLAPEQRLTNSSDFMFRLNLINGTRWSPNGSSFERLRTAGCEIDTLVGAYQSSPRAFNDWLSQRYFRGAMPPSLRSNVELLIRQPQWGTPLPEDGTAQMTDFALSTAYYGVIK
jgi:uncharacterized protein (DUF1800 family)